MESPAKRDPLILASSSPRRQQLLAMLGYPFEVAVPDEHEETAATGPMTDSRLGALVEGNARAKATAVAAAFPDRLIVGADTVVALEGHVLGKPADPDEARDMLARLSGRWHTVFTGVAIYGPRASFPDGDANGCVTLTRHSRTDVLFRTLKPAWIERYVETGEPLDKAGAYGIQGRGSLFVAEIRGCYFTVVGLPLAMLSEMLERWGVSLL